MAKNRQSTPSQRSAHHSAGEDKARVNPLLLYTDGVTESFDGRGEEFGEERLVETLRRNLALPAQRLLASVVDEVRAFSPQDQHDDLTLIVAKCNQN